MSINLKKGSSERKRFNLFKVEATDVKQVSKGKPKTRLWLLLLLAVCIGTWLLYNHNVKNDAGLARQMASTEEVFAEATDGTHPHKEPNDTTTVAIATYAPNVNAGGTNVDSIPGNVLANPSIRFEAGSSSLEEMDSNVISDIASRLKKDTHLNIKITGYASSEGDLFTNQSLARSRADNFKRLLVKKGVPSTRIETDGMGIKNPVASNETEEGRSQNRRIEIAVIKR